MLRNRTGQDQRHFEKALFDSSTSPLYVLITVVDDRTGQSRTGCTPAPFLLGAIDREYGLGGDEASYDRGVQIALSGTDHVFHFSRQEALDNVRFDYTQTDMMRARDVIGRYGIARFLKALAEHNSDLSDLRWSGALACALVEIGMSARQADLTGQISAEP